VPVECSNHPFYRNPTIARHDEPFRVTPIGPCIDSHRCPPVLRTKLRGEEPYAIDKPCLHGAICLEHEAKHCRLLVIIENGERALLPSLERWMAERRRLDTLWQTAADRPQCFERLSPLE